MSKPMIFDISSIELCVQLMLLLLIYLLISMLASVPVARDSCPVVGEPPLVSGGKEQSTVRIQFCTTLSL